MLTRGSMRPLVPDAFAETELEAAVAGLDRRCHPADRNEDRPCRVTTGLATAVARRFVVLQDARESLEEEVDILEQHPLGKQVLVLQDRRGRGLALMGVTHHPDPMHPPWPERRVPDRLRLSAAANRYLSERLDPGLTLVVSDLAAAPDRRSEEDFVTMTREALQSPRPVVRP